MDLSNETLGLVAAGASAVAAIASFITALYNAKISHNTFKHNNTPKISAQAFTQSSNDKAITLDIAIRNSGTGTAHIKSIVWFLRGKRVEGWNLKNEIYIFIREEGFSDEDFIVTAFNGNKIDVSPGEEFKP
ncbi:hypothetical protein, partial [Pseudoteredinibacter isoporae]|uniref:hypothetical protein n=1 Tax=Pseudoteredinibacter isoporae TaxID=570281 RepID=UPI0033424604